MARWTTLGVLSAVIGVALLSGCQSAKAPYNQPVVAVFQETSRENPIEVTLTVDGRDVFGPIELAPGAGKRVAIHETSLDSTNRLSLADSHRISWKLHKNHAMGKVGNAELTIYSGPNPVASANTKYLMPLFTMYGWLDLSFQQPPGAVQGPSQSTTPAKSNTAVPRPRSLTPTPPTPPARPIAPSGSPSMGG